MQVKAILFLVCLYLSLPVMAIDDISLRLNPSYYDEQNQTIYVDVELRYQGHGQFQLADQNYRLFYDSKILTLEQDHSRSDLPQDLYSGIQFMEILENLDADAVNQLSFDDNMGFVNFFIDLNSASNAGISIKSEDDWQRVAVLNFKVSDKNALSQIVWSKTGATDSYATAFVEIMKWIAPNETEPVQVEEYIDARFNIEEELGAIKVAISPNPSTDFIKLSFDRGLESDMNVTVYDINGRKVKQTMAYQNAERLNLAVMELSPSTYSVELTPIGSKQVVHSASFVKISK